MFKILLADDENIENEALKIIIEERMIGAEVVGSTSEGEEAVFMSQAFCPDLVVLGVMMPGVTGLDVAETIKKADPNKKIIMISSSDKFELIQRALRIRVDDYLLKPIRPEGLIEILTNYMLENRKTKIEHQIATVLKCFQECDYSQMKDHLYSSFHNFKESDFEEACYFAETMLKALFQYKHESSDEKNEECIDTEDILNNCKSIQQIREVLFTQLDQFLQAMPYQVKTSNQGDCLKFALNYIEKNYKNNIMLQDVADELNFSNAYLSKRFKKDLGTNFNKYLTQRRMEEAKRLLSQTKTSINDIAFDIGYNEPNYFCKVFKKSEGITPSEYRDKNKNKNSID